MNFLSKLLLGLAFLANTAMAGSDNSFESVTVGFEVSKPASWQFVTAEQNLENLKNTKLHDEKFQRLIIKHSTAPLVVMMKYPEPYEDLNPSFKVQTKPFGQLKGTDPKQILTILSGQMKNALKDFTITQTPTDAIVSGIKSAYMRINYSLQASDGRTFPTTSELWIVPKDEYFFMMGAGTRQDEKTGSRKEIQQIVDSVKIRQ